MSDLYRLIVPERPLLFLSFFAASLAFFGAAYVLYLAFVRPLFSSVRYLDGPARSSWIFGNVASVIVSPPAVMHTQWTRTYGGVLRYHGLFGGHRICVTDPAALTHILLTNPYQFPKPADIQAQLGRILGKGLLFAEGDDHKRQRRIMQPAFSPSHLREITPVFFTSAYKLRDRWMDLLASGVATDGKVFGKPEDQKRWESEHKEGEVVMDVSSWFSRATLDIIGQAGFGYDFGSLDQQDNKLAKAFSGMFSANAGKPSPRILLIQLAAQGVLRFIPMGFVAKYLPNKRIQAVREAFTTMEKESKKILVEKRAQIDREDRGAEKGPRAKDLIALLLRSQESDAKSQMTEAELLGQMTTFLLAGHETTSTALTWLVWRLAKDPEVQTKLREELRAARRTVIQEGRDELNSDELNALPFLDAVCKEGLRLDAPATISARTNAEDCVLPLSRPILSRDGRMLDSVPLKAGQSLFIPILTVNRNPDLFGADADVFRPSRWTDGSLLDKAGLGVGTWSPLMTFWYGSRGCIGYKFAILELKALAAVIVENFVFAEREPGLEITPRATLVQRTVVEGEEELGFVMPLRVSLASAQ